MDMISNLAASIGKYFIYTTAGEYPADFYTDPLKANLRSDLIDNAVDFWTAQSCARQSRAAGAVLSSIINVETPDAVYFKDLAFDLSETIVQVTTP